MDKKHKNTKTEKLHTSDKNASPYRSGQKNGMRNGNAQAGKSGYGTRPVKKAAEKGREKIIKLFPEVTETDKHRKIENARKRERVRKQQLRAALGLGLALVVAIVLIFMTPLFNIREIRLNGNDTVSKEIINTRIGDLIDVNLFAVSVSDVKERMSQIPQIGEVEVKKAVFPSRLELYITESRPAGYVLCGETTLVIDSDLRIIDDASVFDYEALPSISGVSVSEYELNKPLKIKSEEKKEILGELLKAFEAAGIIDAVKYVSIDDLTSITFNYDNRLDVLCGSQLQLDRKIRMFAECIRTSTFDENSIGSIDLSVPGKAKYDP